MRLAQEVGRAHLVVADHAEQRGAIAPPVGQARGVDRVRAGRGDAIAQHTRDVHVHVGADRREDRMRGIMQGIVQIEQPQRRGRVNIWHGQLQEDQQDYVKGKKIRCDARL
jgi:hypothetical protein